MRCNNHFSLPTRQAYRRKPRPYNYNSPKSPVTSGSSAAGAQSRSQACMWAQEHAAQASSMGSAHVDTKSCHAVRTQDGEHACEAKAPRAAGSRHVV
jgi:hypothetical protein